jgi:hypothetical protein
LSSDPNTEEQEMKRAQPRNPARLLPVVAAVAALAALAAAPAHASSHREAPSITTTPKVDGTDFYMFNSYEPARLTGPGYVTLVANYLPLQDAYGGPNYFKLDPNALYEIHVDNNGDGKEDITFQFRFNNTLRGTTLKIGGTDVAIPLTQSGQITAPNATTSNVNETFTVDIVRGDRRTGTRGSITNATGGSATFAKPVDNIGMKTIPNYAAYAAQHIYAVNIPGCMAPGKVFVGQRKDPFAVNLGVVFDLLNVPGAADFTPAEAAFLLDNSKKDAGEDDLADANVTTLALEVPTSCLLASGANDPVIGGWTTASLRQGSLLSSAPKSGHQTSALTGGAWTQVSRLGMPLVNELVIGLPDKDKFNNSKPKDDGQFADLRDQSDLARAGRDRVGHAGHRAHQLPAHGPGDDLPHRHRRRQPAEGVLGLAGDGRRFRDAAPQHGDSSDRRSVAEPPRPARRTARPCAAGPRRLSERAPAERRRRRHLADRGHGRPVRRQRQRRHLQVRRRLQAERRAARHRRLRPSRRRRPGRREGQGQRPAAAGVPVPRHAAAGAK